MLLPAAAGLPPVEGQRSYGTSGESAAKYAKINDGRPLLAEDTEQLTVLGDITNAPKEQHKAAGYPVWVQSVKPKGTPSSRLCDPANPNSKDSKEAESTGLGCNDEMSSEEEDAFVESDFEGFPMGTGTSCIPRDAISIGDEEIDEMFLGLEHEKTVQGARSAAPTEEAAGSQRGEEVSGDAPMMPSWRSPANDQRPLLPEGEDVGEPPGWQGSAASAVPPAGEHSSGALHRLLGVLRVGHEDDPEGSASCLVEGDQEEDAQDVTEYSLDIYDRLGRAEMSPEMPQPDYMETQHELSQNMRAAAVDWLVEVQVKFKLRMETLFLAVSLLDRFLATKRVKRKDLQLTVVSATFIAAKFEEIDPPDVRDFVFITKQACTKEAILTMEVAMLTALEFCLCRPTAAHFLERYQRTNRCSEAHRHLFQYTLELALMDLRMLRYSPSQQAAAALLVSCGLLNRRPIWPAALVRQAEVAEKSIRRCARDMCLMLEAAPNHSLQAVRRKFLRNEYSSVASLDF